jgi:hypothetical protein
MVLFAAKTGAATNGGADFVSVYAWETESLLSEYIEGQEFLKQIEYARKRAISTNENEWKYSYQLAAEKLGIKIFGGHEEMNRKRAEDALKVFQELVKQKGQEPIVFARMQKENKKPFYLPLGILAAASPSQSRFLDKRIILVEPLPRERYPGGVHPVGAWAFNVPEELEEELSEKSNNALGQLGKNPPYRRDISTVKSFFNPGEPTVPIPSPEGVLLLAHQANGNLWFKERGLGFGREEIKRQFPDGSIAILSACSTASSIGNNQAILEKLNEKNIDAMIISPFPVDADYGAMLAINFIQAIENAKQNSKDLSLAELFSIVAKQTASSFKVEKKHFDDMDLEFLIAGDYRIKIALK